MLRTIRSIVERVAFGPRVTHINHDYVTLRTRYSHHRGAYGWHRKFKAFGVILDVKHRFGKTSVNFRRVWWPIERDHPHRYVERQWAMEAQQH